MKFNSAPPTVLHVDINSCFATIEQQANPNLRGQAIAVAAYDSPRGCILAPSIEAKRFGVKTGMMVAAGKALCPELFILPPDPPKYRFVHEKLYTLLSHYTYDIYPKSIDEFVLHLEGYPRYQSIPGSADVVAKRLGNEIKERIRGEVGEWISVSVGFGPNRFLAKTAASYQKPDGLTVINKQNFWEIYETLSLTDLNGINVRNEARLNRVGIRSVCDFYASSLESLKLAFRSVLAKYWYLRLRGWEVDDVDFARRSYGNSYSLPQAFSSLHDLSPILTKLVVKSVSRMRRAQYSACGFHLGVLYRGHYWHKGVTYPQASFDTSEILRRFNFLLSLSPREPVRKLAVSLFELEQTEGVQGRLFEDVGKNKAVTQAFDKINERWGMFTVFPGTMLGTEDNVPDRIGFGNLE